MKAKELFVLFMIFLAGCSASKQIEEKKVTTYDERLKDTFVTIKNLKAKQHFIRGLTYSLQELPEKAIIEFQEALFYEENPSINFALGLQFFKLNKVELSLKYLEKILELPDAKLHPDFLLVTAQIYLTKRDFQKATQMLERVLKIDSNNVDALYSLAQLSEMNDKNKSLELYEKILKIQPENRLILEALLNLYYENGNFEKTEEILKKIVYIEPIDIEPRLRLVAFYREIKKDNEAKKLLYKISERFPDEPLPKIQLIEISIDEKNYTEVIKLFNEITNQIEIDPNLKSSIFDFTIARAIKDSILCDELINHFNNQNRSDDTLSQGYYLILKIIKSGEVESIVSEDDFANAFKRDILKKFGIQFYYDGLEDLSINLLTKIYKYYEKDFDINAILGQALLSKNEYLKAINYLNKAFEQSPKNSDLLVAISYALGKLKKYDEAIYYSQKALQLDRAHRNALIHLGLLLDDTGYFDKCDSLYEEALKIYPDDPTLLNNYAYSLAKRKVNLDKALAMSKKSLEKDSLVDSYLDTLGWIYFQMDEIELAKKYIKLAIEQGSPSAEILEHMGDIYMKLNDKQSAREYYLMALKLDPENQSIMQKLKETE